MSASVHKPPPKIPAWHDAMFGPGGTHEIGKPVRQAWTEDAETWEEPANDDEFEPKPEATTSHDSKTGEVKVEDVPPAGPETATEVLTHVPGLVGQVTDWIEATSRNPNRVLALGAAVAVVGTLVGRRIGGPTMSGTHLYVVVLAPSGAGKDHALRRVPQLLEAANAGQLAGPAQFMSMTAMTQNLTDTPLCLSAMDEFGAYLCKLTHPRASPHEKMILAIMRDSWGASFETMPLPRWAGVGQRKSEPVVAPAMSLYGASTPGEFFDALQGKDVINGFLNRFLILVTDKSVSDREPPESKRDFPTKLKKALNKLYLDACTVTPEEVANPFQPHYRFMPWKDQAAKDEFARVKAIVEPFRGDDKLKAFYARTVEIALRLATIRAVGQDINGSVSAADMKWGFDVALLSTQQVVEAADEHMAENDFARNGNSIVAFMKKRKGPFTRRDFSQHMRALTNQDLTSVLDKLCEAGRVEAKMPIPKVGASGRPSVSMLYRLSKAA